MKRNWIIVLIIAVIMITAIICVFLQTKDDNSKSDISDCESEIICTDSIKISSLIDKVLNLPEMRPYVDNLNKSRFGLVIENNSDSGIDIEDAIQNFKKNNPPTENRHTVDVFDDDILKASIGFGKIEIKNDSALVWAGFGVTYAGMIPLDRTWGGITATFVFKDCVWELIESQGHLY